MSGSYQRSYDILEKGSARPRTVAHAQAPASAQCDGGQSINFFISLVSTVSVSQKCTFENGKRVYGGHVMVYGQVNRIREHGLD